MAFPEATLEFVAAWDDHPTFRVRGKNYLFCDHEGTSLGLKIDREEAVALTDSDPDVEPMGYGLDRSGWISVTLPTDLQDEDRWAEITEWLTTSYCLIAPKSLSRQVERPDPPTSGTAD